MPDRLSGLLQRFELRARVFHRGPLCGVAAFAGEGDGGMLHLIRRGPVTVIGTDGRHEQVTRPSLMFVPRPAPHRLEAEPNAGAEIVCAAIDFGAGDENPLLRALPAQLRVAIDEVPALGATQALLFGEAFGLRCGHATVVDRLSEVLLVQLLRWSIERRLVDGGLLAGLADPRLARALTAAHAEPARAWTLERLAAEAGMSRSRFAARFTQVVGLPAGEYLARWRVGLAKGLLRRGRPVKQVAIEVGYGSASAFARVFAQVVGQTPSGWLARPRA
jgi:AraC-like DNA-binding protein